MCFLLDQKYECYQDPSPEYIHCIALNTMPISWHQFQILSCFSSVISLWLLIYKWVCLFRNWFFGMKSSLTVWWYLKVTVVVWEKIAFLKVNSLPYDCLSKSDKYCCEFSPLFRDVPPHGSEPSETNGSRLD